MAERNRKNRRFPAEQQVVVNQTTNVQRHSTAP
jgi:hypothetical protein